MQFADRLKELRKEKDLTQDEFAKKINKTRSTVAGYETERKQPEYDTLVEIAEFFGVSVDYLLGKTNKRKWDTETIALNTVAVDGLSEEEVEHIRGLIELMKKKHGK